MTLQFFPFTDNAKDEAIRNDLLENPRKWLEKNFTRFSFGSDSLIKGFYRERGWYYVVRPFLRRYVYHQYDHWYEAYAINKTHLRKIVGGRIDEILA